MPHRIGHLKERIVTLENVCAAADEYNRNRPKRLRRRFDIEWLNDIATDLANDRFVWDVPREKDIIECGKWRHLKIPSLRSAIAQGAIFRVVNPIIDRRLPEMSYSSRKGRGGHALARKAARFIRTKGRKARYCLYFDLKKYYDHIKIDTAVEILGRIIKDEWVLGEVKAMFSNVGAGLPIGYVGSHQLANLYVADIFRHLRTCERSVGFGSVYMDNFSFLGEHKAPLHRMRRRGAARFAGRGLEMKRDWQVFPVGARGVRIGGLVLVPRGTARLYRRIHHRSMRAMDRLFRRPTERRIAGCASRFGWYMAVKRENIIFNRLKKEKAKCVSEIFTRM